MPNRLIKGEFDRLERSSSTNVDPELLGGVLREDNRMKPYSRAFFLASLIAWKTIDHPKAKDDLRIILRNR